MTGTAVVSRRAALLLAPLLALGSARIHNLKVTNDPRYAFSIESFGFLEGGSVSVHVRHVDAKPAGVDHAMGFVLYPSTTESRIAEQVRTHAASAGPWARGWHAWRRARVLNGLLPAHTPCGA